MKFNYGSKSHKKIECDCCGIKNFEGIRYLCGNCDYVNICEKCYNKGSFDHTKTHVFIRIPIPITKDDSVNPKTLIPHRDPQLYPLKKLHKEHIKDEEKKDEPLSMKRSLTVLAEKAKTADQLDIDQALPITYNICQWVCKCKSMNEKSKAVALKLCSELLCILLKLSQLNR